MTGRPYTLIFNGSVTSSGAVGIALSAGRRPASQTKFPGLRAITPPLIVTRYVLVGAVNLLSCLIHSLPLGRRVTLSMSWITGILRRCLSLLSRRAHFPKTWRKKMGSILGCCETVNCGKSNESCPEVPRGERWRLRLRRLPGKAHPFRSVCRHP